MIARRVLLGAAIFLIVLAAAALIAAFNPFAPKATMVISPWVVEPRESFDETALTAAALDTAMNMTVMQGETLSTEAYVMTLGQWFTINDIRQVLVGGRTRNDPVFIVKATGRYAFGDPGSTPPTHDRLVGVIDARTGQFVGSASYPIGHPDFTFDVWREDANLLITPQSTPTP